ncbi:nudix hydrolase-like protein [Chamberlinius hualienensis]
MEGKVFEYVSRVGKQINQNHMYQKTSECTCVVIVAILKRPLMLDCLLLLKQYRPTLGNMTLEFPVAVVEEHETAETAAVRDIEDLTGYKGTVMSKGELSAFDAGISNYTARLMVVQINGGDSYNKNIRFQSNSHHNNNEGVDVVAIPMQELNHRLSNFIKDGIVVDSRVEMYAVGLKTNAARIQPTMIY